MRLGVAPKVLQRGYAPVVSGIITLHTLDRVHAQLRGHLRIFAVKLLAAPPVGNANTIDVRRPEGQAVVDGTIVVAQRFIVLGACFRGDYDAQIFR